VAGTIKVGNLVDILRRENKIGVGKIVGLQQSKVETKEVQEGLEFGGMIESDKEIASGDVLESFVMIKK
jgi:translation initiation factor IF-2